MEATVEAGKQQAVRDQLLTRSRIRRHQQEKTTDMHSTDDLHQIDSLCEHRVPSYLVSCFTVPSSVLLHLAVCPIGADVALLTPPPAAEPPRPPLTPPLAPPLLPKPAL